MVDVQLGGQEGHELPRYRARIVPNLGLRAEIPTWQCRAPGCEEKIWDAIAVRVEVDGDVWHLHPQCTSKFEHGWDDCIPAIGILVFEEANGDVGMAI